MADYGIRLNEEDQRRRLVILSLLQAEGLGREHYARRFGSDVLDDLPELLALVERGLATFDEGRVQLTAAALERSDAIGPWLYSRRVRQRMEEYSWR
jgi:oxygen-independent coproporphyrinogen-3 oxidase